MINSLSKAITIDNCNCINHAELTVVPKQLNIKFGVNGIGKSTIGKAIATISADNQKAALGELLPYGADIQNRFPSISGLDNDTKVKVFNAQYANQFIIEGGTGDTLFENSFQVFLRSSDCEELMIEINKQLDALQKAFVNQPDFNEIFEMLSKIQDVIKMKGETVSRAGGLGEVIKGNGLRSMQILNLTRPIIKLKILQRLLSGQNGEGLEIKSLMTATSVPSAPIPSIELSLMSKTNP